MIVGTVSFIWHEYITGQPFKSPVQDMLFHPPKPFVHVDQSHNFYSTEIVHSPEEIKRNKSINFNTRNDATYLFLLPCTKNVRMSHSNSERKLFVFCHGNSSNIRTKLQDIKNMQSSIASHDILWYMLAVEYDGYTEDTCKQPIEPNKIAWKTQCIIRKVSNNYNIEESNIVLCGHSIGTGIAIQIADEYITRSSIILVSPYTSICAIANDVSKIGGFLVRERFKSLERACRFEGKSILILHGIHDALIKIKHADRLHDACKRRNIVTYIKMSSNHDDICWVSIASHILAWSLGNTTNNWIE
jgi:hypothetical protein